MPEIFAQQRTELGKKTKTLRTEAVLPTVLYGEGIPSTPLSVPAKDFERVFREAGETSLVTLRVDSGKAYNVLIHDVAKDPLTLKPIHADFYAVRMDKPIAAKVPLAFVGESPAVENEGGILVKVLHELEIKALPQDLPHEIVVDLARLEHIENKIHVQDLVLPPGVATSVATDEVVALVEQPRSEAELGALLKAEVAAPAMEVKTEREAKAEAKVAEATEEAEESAQVR